MSQTGYDAKDGVWSLFNVSWDPMHEGLSATLNRVTERCAEYFHASGASLFLEVEGTNEFLLMAKSGIEATAPDGTRIRKGEGIAGLSIETGQPLLITNRADHPALPKGSASKTKIGSSMVVPLHSPHAGTVGVINLTRGAKTEDFNEEDLKLASSVANVLALTVTNARLFGRANQAAREARAMQSKLQNVIQTLGVAIIVVDEDQEVTNANPQALLLLNRAEHEHSGLRDAIRSTLLDASKSSSTLRKRFEEQAKNRSWSIVCSPLPGGGATAVIEEVTEYEQAIEEVSRLSRLAEIGQMTAAIAHEIRNPLTGIRSSAQMIGQLAPDAEELADIIEQEAIKLNTLCDEFLEFARPLALRIADCTLGSIAKSMATQYARDFEAAGVAFFLDIARDEPVLAIDPLRIEQVMRNLILNALQACAPGQWVRLTIGKGWFKVADSGKGMEQDTVHRLFTPFFTTRPQGTGLGLSNVRKIIDAHGGSISVESAPLAGTTFQVQLQGAA